MSDTDSDTEFDPVDEAAASLLRQMSSVARMPPQHSEGLFLEAIQFDTSALEESLKRSAGSELRHRHDEMEAYSDSLEQSLQEVRRIRTLEESVMSSRVAAAQEAFAKDLGELKRQYKMQVQSLEREALAFIEEQRKECERTIAERVRDLGTQLAATAGLPASAVAPTAVAAGTGSGATGGWRSLSRGASPSREYSRLVSQRNTSPPSASVTVKPTVYSATGTRSLRLSASPARLSTASLVLSDSDDDESAMTGSRQPQQTAVYLGTNLHTIRPLPTSPSHRNYNSSMRDSLRNGNLSPAAATATKGAPTAGGRSSMTQLRERFPLFSTPQPRGPMKHRVLGVSGETSPPRTHHPRTALEPSSPDLVVGRRSLTPLRGSQYMMRVRRRGYGLEGVISLEGLHRVEPKVLELLD